MKHVTLTASDYKTLQDIAYGSADYRAWIQTHPEYGRVGTSSVVRWLLVTAGFDLHPVRGQTSATAHRWHKIYADAQPGDWFYGPAVDKHADGDSFWHALTMHSKRTGKAFRAVPGVPDGQEHDGTWWRRYERTE